MTLPSNARSPNTSGRILEAALRLFVQNGYHGTSVANIAQAVDLTPGALYRHFQSKEELLLALVRRYETEYLDRLAEVIEAAGPDARNRFQRLMRFWGRFGKKNPNLAVLVSVVSAEFQDLGGAVNDELDRIYIKYTGLLRRLIEEGKRQNYIDLHLDTHSLAYMLIGFKEGAFLKYVHNRRVLDANDYLNTFFRFIFQGIGTPPPSASDQE